MAGGILLQSAATSGNGNEWHCRGLHGTYVLSVVGTGTISAGAGVWEQAPSSGYAGTWEPLAEPVAPVSDTLITKVFTGAPQIVRFRITTSVAGGGSVTVKMQPPRVAEPT